MLATLNDYDLGGGECLQQIEERKLEINAKDAELKELDGHVAQLEHSLGIVKNVAKPGKVTVRPYKFVRGDEVDEALANYINQMSV